MEFQEEKAQYITALHAENYKDASKKGSVDEQIIPLLNAINRQPDYFTTSSCAGRITLFVSPDSGKKHDGHWLFASHDLVAKEILEQALEQIPQYSQEIFFRQEACILHVCCKDIQVAQDIIDKARFCGFKRSGIISTRKRVIVELLSTERLDTIIAKNGALLVSSDYMETLRKVANRLLTKTRTKMEKFRTMLLEEKDTNESISPQRVHR